MFGLLGGLAIAGASMYAAKKGSKDNKRTLDHQAIIEEKNYQQRVKEWEYQKELNDLVMEREDNAVQRRVADLKSSGLSPTLAAGSAAGSTALKAGTAPTHDTSYMTNFLTRQQMAYEQKVKGIETAMNFMSNYSNIAKTRAEARRAEAEANSIEANTPLDTTLKKQAIELNESLNPKRIAEYDLKLDGMATNNLLAKMEVGLKEHDEVLKRLEITSQSIGIKLKEAGLSVEQQRLATMALEYVKLEQHIAANEKAGMPIEYLPEKMRYLEYIKNGVGTLTDKEREEWNQVKETVKGWIDTGKEKASSIWSKLKGIMYGDYGL